MAIAVNRNRIHPYVLKAERALDEEKQTLWRLRTLPAERKALVDSLLGKYMLQLGEDLGHWVSAKVSEDSAPAAPSPELMEKATKIAIEDGAKFVLDCKEICAIGIADAVRFLDHDGNPVIFVADGDRLSPEQINMIPDDALPELALACMSVNRITEHDRGNSSSLSAS